MSSEPLALTDDQLSQIFRCAQPLPLSSRSAFLREVAHELNGHEIGDGLVQRVCREVQRKYFDVPDLSRSHAGKYG